LPAAEQKSELRQFHIIAHRLELEILRLGDHPPEIQIFEKDIPDELFVQWSWILSMGFVVQHACGTVF
jgi:hypothetical protein